MEVPFERIGMDLIGPLERSARGHRFALVLVDYATRYPQYTNTIQIKLEWALFVTYTIIQSIMRSEMCSLHLTHPSVHTWSSGQPTVQRPGSSRGLPVGAGMSGSSAPALHLGEERGRGTVSTHLPSGNPERDSHGSGHGVYVTHDKGAVRASTGFSPFELLYGLPYRHYPRKRQPSPRRLDYTNS